MGHILSTHTVQTSGSKTPSTRDNSDQDFRLFCSFDKSRSDLSAAIHALYYLPDNYKLVIVGDTKDHGGHMMPLADKAIMDRITFEDQTELSTPKTTTPFSYTNVIVEGTTQPSIFEKALAPHVTMSDSADAIVSDDNHGFRVATGSPEAVATAVLRITRTIHA